VRGTIAFAMLQESGHLNPTLRLARGLSDAGFEVVYFAIPELARFVENQGFRALPWFPELYGEGAAERESSLPALQRRRTLTARFTAMADTLAKSGGPLAALRGLRGPVFTLVDVTQPLMAFALRRAGLPFAYVHTSLPQTRDGAVPPLRSAQGYEADGKRARLAWGGFLAKRALSAAAVTPFGVCPSYALTPLLARRFGVGLGELRLDTMFMPQLRGVRELVLCPSAFDFPRPVRADRHEAESVDLARREQPFDFGALSESAPLVYASLGSQLYAGDQGRLFLTTLMHAFTARPDLQLLVSLGKHVRRDELGELPNNVHAVQSAPQLAVLRRAGAMVTHGGLGSIKECMLHGVPVLVCPLDVDQPGNAARVEHHGVGARTQVSDTRPERLLWLVDNVLRDPAIRAATGRMQQAFRAVEEGGRGASLVAEWASQAGWRAESGGLC
jgi:zeaxanthin glucosyltransferase